MKEILVGANVRYASEVDIGFPYYNKSVCYILVGDGCVNQLSHSRKSDLPQVAEACKKVLEGEAKLFAVWPGQYRSDLFYIDDIKKFAQELNLTI